jgi:hypothetical protein
MTVPTHDSKGRTLSMKRRRTILLAVLAAVAASIAATAALADTSVKDYVVPVGDHYEVDALLSVGDQVPWAGGSGQYRMVGIPDGLGAHKNADGTSTLFMNHELNFAAISEPVVGGPKNRGAIVSKWILDEDGDPISGRRAYDTVWNENQLLGPAPDSTNVAQMPRQFGRFCSGSIAGPAEGFDRYIYFTNEEVSASESFDGLGGLAVAIFDSELHTLPKLGRFPWENTLVQARPGDRTVIMGLEDGPAAQDPSVTNSQVYMYVGKKERNQGASVLRRNGLDNGELYVLVPESPAKSDELAFTRGSIDVEWALIPNAGALSEAQLEAASDAVGAFRFARPEDGAFDKRRRNQFYFVTTGDAAVPTDTLGRLYSLQLHPGDPTKEAELRIVYSADAVIAAGGDIAISPDNIDTSRRFLMINEDGTGASRPVMAAKGRDGSIWRFELDDGGVEVSSRRRVAQLNPPGRDGVAVGAGIWETSGVLDASALFGPNTWLSDVQAHPPTAAPEGSTVTVEDGQLFLLRPGD